MGPIKSIAIVACWSIHLHFRYEENEAQKGYLICLWAWDCQKAEQDIEQVVRWQKQSNTQYTIDLQQFQASNSTHWETWMDIVEVCVGPKHQDWCLKKQLCKDSRVDYSEKLWILPYSLIPLKS